jgi:hypothetical protein
MTARVTVVGILYLDLLSRAPRIHQPGEAIIDDQYRNVPGAKRRHTVRFQARILPVLLGLPLASTMLATIIRSNSTGSLAAPT